MPKMKTQDDQRLADTIFGVPRQWRLKPEERGHIRTTIQLLVRGEWEDAYEGADASTTALLVQVLNDLEAKAARVKAYRILSPTIRTSSSLTHETIS